MGIPQQESEHLYLNISNCTTIANYDLLFAGPQKKRAIRTDCSTINIKEWSIYISNKKMLPLNETILIDDDDSDSDSDSNISDDDNDDKPYDSDGCCQRETKKRKRNPPPTVTFEGGQLKCSLVPNTSPPLVKVDHVEKGENHKPLLSGEGYEYASFTVDPIFTDHGAIFKIVGFNSEEFKVLKIPNMNGICIVMSRDKFNTYISLEEEGSYHQIGRRVCKLLGISVKDEIIKPLSYLYEKYINLNRAKKSGLLDEMPKAYHSRKRSLTKINSYISILQEGPISDNKFFRVVAKLIPRTIKELEQTDESVKRLQEHGESLPEISTLLNNRKPTQN